MKKNNDNRVAVIELPKTELKNILGGGVKPIDLTTLNGSDAKEGEDCALCTSCIVCSNCVSRKSESIPDSLQTQSFRPLSGY